MCTLLNGWIRICRCHLKDLTSTPYLRRKCYPVIQRLGFVLSWVFFLYCSRLWFEQAIFLGVELPLGHFLATSVMMSSIFCCPLFGAVLPFMTASIDRVRFPFSVHYHTFVWFDSLCQDCCDFLRLEAHAEELRWYYSLRSNRSVMSHALWSSGTV